MTNLSTKRLQQLAGLLKESDDRQDHQDWLLNQWGGKFLNELPPYKEMSPEQQSLWKRIGPPPNSKEEYENKKLQDVVLEKWWPIFKAAGLDENSIDFSDVSPGAIEAMGKALKEYLSKK